jgi:hypothetical protein
MAASPLTSRPRGSNVNANGTGVADGFSTAVSDSVPSRRTLKMSIVLPLAFVVTISLLPSGVNRPGRAR